jgi:hypothetical protein
MLDENGKVTFNEAEQKEVDRILNERFGREGIADMREIMETLKDFDYTGTPAEVKAAIKQQAEIYKQQKAEAAKQQELEDLQEEARKKGTSPELTAEIKALKDEIAELKKDKENAKKAADEQKKGAEVWNTQVSEFKEKHPEIDLAKLDKDEKFIKFVRRSHPGLSLTEKYEDYLEFVGGAQADAIKRIQSNIDRSTSSGRQGGDKTGGTYGLTPNQQALAKENDMTFEEYANYLKHIKKG